MLDNIYCLIYRYRRQGSFQVGDKLVMNLPTKNVEMELKKNAHLKILGKTVEAFYMESSKSEYKVWFDNSENKVPLRIDGALGLSKTSMILVEHSQ